VTFKQQPQQPEIKTSKRMTPLPPLTRQKLPINQRKANKPESKRSNSTTTNYFE
jgi:hypothetical protein